MLCLPVAAGADVVHQWVDADGVTHFSDQLPATADVVVETSEFPNEYPQIADVSSDYYSIANQWQRMKQEREDEEKLKIERAKARAALQQAQQPPPPAQSEHYLPRTYPIIYPVGSRGRGFHGAALGLHHGDEFGQGHRQVRHRKVHHVAHGGNIRSARSHRGSSFARIGVSIGFR